MKIRLSFANVAAGLALFIALSGTSYAALKGPRNSVGTTQLRKGAVTSAKVRDGSLTLRDFNPSDLGQLRGQVGPAGPAGPGGPVGTVGPEGPRGETGAASVVVRRREDGALPAGAFDSMTVSCKPGERATGGGIGFTESGGGEIVEQSFPVHNGFQPVAEGDTPTGWSGIIKNGNANALAHPVIYVICVAP